MTAKWEDNGFKTPLARVRGLGAARSAVEGWMTLRITAIANIPLIAWFVWFVIQSVGLSHEQFTAFLAQPVNAVLMILFIVSAFWHGYLGSKEIVEDYVHLEWFKMMKLIGMKLFMFAGAVIGIFCVLKIAFGG